MARKDRNSVSSTQTIQRAIELAAASATPALFETLERRQLLSSTLVGDKLVIEGTPGNDVVTLTLGGNGATIDVQESGSLAQFSTASVKSIQISTGDGNDRIMLSNQVITFTKPVFKQIKLPPALIAGGSGNDTIQGGPSADTIYGDNKPLVILPPTTGRGDGGGVGPSALRLIDFDGTGDDQISGGADNDTISGGNGNDTLSGEAGNDSIRAGNGADQLNGGAGNDSLYGEGGPDYISCGTAADGADLLSGGPQGVGTSDTLDYSQRTIGVMVAPGASNISGQPGENDTVLADFEATFGGKGNDTLLGRSDAFEQLYGNDGDDRLVGNGNTDWMQGGKGNDTLEGGDGDDQLDGGEGNNLLLGGAGDDDLIARGGSDTISGGAGVDSTRYDFRSEDLKLYLDGVAHSGAPGENDQLHTDIEHISGGRGNDLIVGNDLDNSLSSSGGRDTIHAGGGNDLIRLLIDGSVVFGESGNDTIDGSDAGDTIDGGAGDDSVRGQKGDDIIDGGGGNDTIDGNEGADVMRGGDGVDEVLYDRAENLMLSLNDLADDGAPGEGDNIGSDFEVVHGGFGDDIIIGSNRGEKLYGRVGNDLIRGNGGDDTIDGGLGSDTIDGGAGRDVLIPDQQRPGEGGQIPPGGTTDTLDYSERNENLTLILNGRPVSGAKGEADTIHPGFEFIRGGNGNDTIVGTDAPERLSGNGGNDIIDGRGGNDTILGGAGNDALKGGSGHDLLDGGDGDDRLDGGRGNDVLRGGAGIDTANYSDRTENLTLRVDGKAHSGAAGEKDTIHTDFEIIRAGSGNDRIFGTARADTIFGGAGNDEIRGLGGNDRLDGGDGNDRLIGGDGNDILIGRAGRDTFYGQNGNDTLYADDRERDHLDGGAGTDRFRGDDFDRLIGVEARL